VRLAAEDGADMARVSLNRREAFAARATAACNGSRATLGLVAGEESVLAFAADLRRLILAFHKFLKIGSGAKTGAC
jgi:hypothetical protein